MKSVHTASCPLKLCTFAPYSHFSLTLQGDELLMRPERSPTNKQRGQEFSLSILSVSITSAHLLGSTSFPTCLVPWVLRRLDGQSLQWTFVLPHSVLSVSVLFVLFHFLLILLLCLSLFLLSAFLSVTHSFMVEDSVSS